jgi:RNA polymerase II subunit A C-terminal domain phosphatase SSU72
MEIRDNHEEAHVASIAMLDLAAAVSIFNFIPDSTKRDIQIEAADDIDEKIDKILEAHQERFPHALLHAVGYY